MAKKRFLVNNQQDSSYKFLRAAQEGKPYTFFFEQNYTTATIGNATVATLTVPMGKYLVLDQIVISSNNLTQPVEMAVQVVATIGVPDQTTNNIIGTRSLETTQIDQREFVIAGSKIEISTQDGIRLYDKTTVTFGTRDSGVTNFTGRIVIRAVGVIYDLDLNWDADFTMIGIGDSILAYLNGGTDYYADMLYFSRIQSFYLNKGQNVRRINKAEGGRNSTNAESWRRDTYYNIQKADLCVYNMQVNDAAAGSGPTNIANYQNNLLNLVNWWQYKNRGKPLIICSATPVTDNTLEASCQLYRQAGYDTINSLTGTKTNGSVLSIPEPLSLRNITPNGIIIYINCGTAFDRLDVQYYNNSLGNGDGLHPNAIRGHLAIQTQKIDPALTAWLPLLI